MIQALRQLAVVIRVPLPHGRQFAADKQFGLRVLADWLQNSVAGPAILFGEICKCCGSAGGDHAA
jgi:hypothetical protein